MVVSLIGVGLIGWGLLDRGAAAGRALLPAGAPAGQRGAADPAQEARVQRERLEQQRKERERTLTAALDAYAAKAPDFALAVVDHKNGWTYAYRGTRSFEEASIVKVDILAALLLQAQDKDRTLTAVERSLARNMIRVSDNVAAQKLYEAIGEERGLAAANKRFGLTKTVPNELCGLTRTTAQDQAKLLTSIFNEKGPLSKESRAFLRELMGSIAADQRWGITAAAKEAERTVLKNGWLDRDTEQGRYIVNSIGRISADGTDVSVAVLSHGHPDQPSGIAEVEKVAKLARVHLGW